MATLLVIDDDRNVRRSVTCLLQAAGHELLTAESSTEAVRMLGARPCDAVLASEPGGSNGGRELISALRWSFPHVPVIVLTDHASVRDAVATIKAGAFDYVEKHGPSEAILGVVERALHAAEEPGTSPPPATLEEVERAHILRVMAKSKTFEEAAATLGIDITTLWRKRKRFRHTGDVSAYRSTR